ncbi:MAG: hypothetical protein RBU37_12470 [Myxococcota bacterium]|jgi:hypothetical protein|nr:hypothetical protein [Myxococcota bacterium]
MRREVTVREFVADLMKRIEDAKTIDCCKEELKTFAQLALEKMPDEKLTVEWKD